jgi:hypothetical protein
MRSIWLSQRLELRRLAEFEGLPVAGEQGDLTSALRFGEMLTLVPTIEKAVQLLREDRQGALSFLDVIANLTDAIENAADQPSTSEMAGPFHELADFAVEFLNELQKLDPTKFE